MPLKIKEAIAVEGKYDTIRLRSAVDTVIVETNGFSLFHDPDRLHLLKTLANTRGLIVLTDSDAAGFVIRDRIAGALPKAGVKHAYIPEIAGKEKRKSTRSAAGLLGVEGMGEETLVQSLLRAGATPEDQTAVLLPPFLTKARLYEDGLSGRPESARLRERLLSRLGFPRLLSANRLIEVCNATLTETEYQDLLEDIKKQEP